MRKAKNRESGSSFLSKWHIGAAALAALVVCFFAAGISCGGWGRPITLLGTPIVIDGPSKADNQQVLDESETRSTGDDYGTGGEWQTERMRVTAYCACSKCCGENANGITACNYKIKEGDVFVAADKKYPFGSEVVIPGYNDGKPVEVLDRGGLIRGNRLDVFFPSHKEALKWGVKYLDVKIHCR